MNEVIPILIPSYQPDERFIDLLKALKEANLGPVVIVDDGSGSEYQHIFKEAEALIVDLGGVLLHHDINRGKGRGLKTGFTFIMEKWPDAIGCITCDSDGQHSPEAILSVRNEMRTHQNALILGSRSFDGDNVPRKSRIGNKFIATMFRYVTGNRIVDTQTGLRGIPMDFMRILPDVKGERFEYETQMLLSLRAEKVGIGSSGYFHDFLHQAFRNEGARGVVRIVQGNHADSMGTGGTEFVQVRHVTIFFFEMEHGDLGPQGPGSGVKLLVAWRKGHDPVSGTDEGEENMLVSAGSAVFGEDVFRGNMVIELCNFFFYCRTSKYGAVALFFPEEIFHEGIPVSSGQVEKFLKRQGLCTGIGNVVGRVFFEPVHPVFYAELFNDHSLSPWK